MEHSTNQAPITSPETAARIASELSRTWHQATFGMEHPVSGVQRQQYWVLVALVDSPKCMSDLAELARTSQASLTGIVDRLERKHLVERVRRVDDRRVVEVHLTATGRDMLIESRKAFIERVDGMVTSLSTEEREQLADLLTKIGVATPAELSGESLEIAS